MDTRREAARTTGIRYQRSRRRSTAARQAVLWLIPLALLAGPGCGGGANLNPTRLEGRLDTGDSRFSDGSLSDFYVATAERNGRAQIEMQSSEFDSYLIVTARNRDGEFENIIEDDDSGGDRNAKLIFEVRKGQTYYIAALDDGAALIPGRYAITFSDILDNVRLNPDSVARAAEGTQGRTAGPRAGNTADTL